jgi:hypothetical protein
VSGQVSFMRVILKISSDTTPPRVGEDEPQLLRLKASIQTMTVEFDHEWPRMAHVHICDCDIGNPFWESLTRIGSESFPHQRNKSYTYLKRSPTTSICAPRTHYPFHDSLSLSRTMIFEHSGNFFIENLYILVCALTPLMNRTLNPLCWR